MKRIRRLKIASLVLLLSAELVLGQQASDTEKWLADFYQLQQAISVHYSNFEWVAHDRHVNLPSLRQRTEDRLRAAKSDSERKQAIESFLRTFGDAHVEIKWAPIPDNRSASNSPAEGRSFCDRLGYTWQDSNGGINWSVVTEFTPIRDSDSQDFPAGVLRMIGKPALGVIRIGWFSEYAHPGLCRVVQLQQAISDRESCDDACQEQFQVRVADLLSAALERRVKSLKQAGAERILIDITGNGGGTNWVEPAARVLTPIQLKSPRYAFVKHQHWVDQLRQRLGLVETDLVSASEKHKRLLEEALATLKRGIADAAKPYNLAAYWTEREPKPGCSNLETELLYVSGIMPYARPADLADLKSASILFYPSRYHYTEGANRLPLIVLVDGDTGSSAEYFAAMLQDNKAARLVGQVTVGAGCGFTEGGIETKLSNSGAMVRLPDCVRLRTDDSNEVNGIVPDVLLPWVERDSRYQQAMKLIRWLKSSWVP